MFGILVNFSIKVNNSAAISLAWFVSSRAFGRDQNLFLPFALETLKSSTAKATKYVAIGGVGVKWSQTISLFLLKILNAI